MSETTQHTGKMADPGWYTDKNGAVRWWDGTQWSNQVRVPQQPPTNQPQPADDNGTLLIWGWITTFLFPLIGFILGIVAVAKGEMQGIAMLLLAPIMFFVWSGILVAA